MKNLFNDIKSSFKDLLLYEFKYLIVLFLVAIICYIPLNYYVIIGGGISNINDRVEVENGYNSKGSLNISYVTSADGVLLTYLLSYIMPNWTRESIEDYKYADTDSVEDIEFRNDLSLKEASSNATLVAFNEANKPIEITSTKYYVISVMEGCNLKVGDEILEIDNKKIVDFNYTEYINSLNEGDEVSVKVLRNKKVSVIKTKIFKVKNRLLMGVFLTKLNTYNTNPEVTIKFKKSESGPSGGLMTALSIYNQLTKNDITNGLTVAGTGTIDEDGNIGEIGGVEYKLRGAVAGGADIFIVPAGDNYEDCKKLVKEEKLKIKLIKAKTFENVVKQMEKIK